jgi:hypothetical protein
MRNSMRRSKKRRRRKKMKKKETKKANLPRPIDHSKSPPFPS